MKLSKGITPLSFGEIIHKNTRWRVGNGHSIKIWHEQWIPEKCNPKIITAPFPLLEEHTVLSLNCPHSKDWDAEAIKDIFHPRDANLILSIPLPNVDRCDKLIWSGEERGNFSIKSCYKAIISELAKLNIWSFIWNLPIPPRAKIFIWQICSNCLPTADFLRSGGIECPATVKSGHI